MIRNDTAESEGISTTLEPLAPTSDLMSADKLLKQGLTFDDVVLIPDYSAVLPKDADTRTWLTPTIALNIPLISAAMDTVTEARLAIALAREGGIGIIHRNLEIDVQAAEVDKVKRSEAGMIVDPITLGPNATVRQAVDLMERYHISGVPITENGKLVGILTNRDIRFRGEPRPARAKRDDQRGPHHGSRRHHVGRGQRYLAPSPHREGAGGRRPLHAQRPNYG